MVLFAFLPGLRDLLTIWFTKADYSHGLMLVPFAGYLLWRNWHQVPATITWPSYSGLPFLMLAVAFHYFSDLNIGQSTARGLSVLIGLFGVALMFCGGTRSWRWVVPPFAIVLLAIPLPARMEFEFSWYLQKIAIIASTFVFQVMGYPAYQPPNQMIITIGETQLEVLKACAGLSMLLTFVSLACAYALVTPKRHWGDRVFLVLSSVPIALICNIGRIVFTGLIYHAGWKEFGDLFVHDFAGWLMMPVALGMLWLEIRFIDWILVPRDTATFDELSKANMQRVATKAAEVAGIPLGSDGRPVMLPKPGERDDLLSGATAPLKKSDAASNTPTGESG